VRRQPRLGWRATDQAVRQPVTAGRYRATFAVIDDLTAFGCTIAAAGSVTCTPSTPWPEEGYVPLCPGSRTLSVDFDLPGQGDVEIAVP
jgi:hypothetical protein